MKTFLDGRVTLHGGDCLDVVRGLADNSIDSVCTDPPYALVSIVKRFGKENAADVEANFVARKTAGQAVSPYARAARGFMGKQWDTGETAFAVEFWAEILRVLRPGGHVAAFGGTRSYHRLACAIEDAGFEIRDQLAWCYGTGFPKSHDVSKGIDKAAGVAFDAKPASGVGFMGPDGPGGYNVTKNQLTRSGESTDAARQWEGWGTALKPAWEPICLARKPLSEKTVAANVLRWGTGAINVDGCRVGSETMGGKEITGSVGGTWNADTCGLRKDYFAAEKTGRFPANLCHDGSDEVLAAFPESKSTGGSGPASQKFTSKIGIYGEFAPKQRANAGGLGDSGSAARFFYSAKASKADRVLSKHPTVKPVKLMQWLVRLITPPNGKTLDPFAGTGTTGEAAWREGFSAVLIEREEEYQADIERRMLFAKARPKAEPAKLDASEPETLPLPLEFEAAYQATMAAE